MLVKIAKQICLSHRNYNSCDLVYNYTFFEEKLMPLNLRKHFRKLDFSGSY